MKYVDFRTQLELIMGGDKIVPAFDKIKSIIHECTKQIAVSCKPFILLSTSIEDKKLQSINKELFVREPLYPTTENHNIDIDEELIYAVIYMVASKICHVKNKIIYKNEYKELVNNYQWERYKNIENSIYDNEASYLKNILTKNEYKKIYTKKYKTIKGYVYEWDNHFIGILNRYLKGEVFMMDISDRLNVEKYLDYQAQKRNDNFMYEELDKYLGVIYE